MTEAFLLDFASAITDAVQGVASKYGITVELKTLVVQGREYDSHLWWRIHFERGIPEIDHRGTDDVYNYEFFIDLSGYPLNENHRKIDDECYRLLQFGHKGITVVAAGVGESRGRIRYALELKYDQ